MSRIRRRHLDAYHIFNEDTEREETKPLAVYSDEARTGLEESSRNRCVQFYLPNIIRPTVVQNREEFIVGRGDGSNQLVPRVDLSLYDAQRLGVSRQHVRIIYKEICFYIEDLNSTNGTWLNYTRMKSQRLIPFESGNIIRLGYLTLRVEVVIN